MNNEVGVSSVLNSCFSKSNQMGNSLADTLPLTDLGLMAFHLPGEME